jgi:hypothetical protein
MALIPADHVPPDRLTLWPVESAEYGLDVSWSGAVGFAEANTIRDALDASGIATKLEQGFDGRTWTVRVGPLPGDDVVRVVSGFLSAR